MRLFSLLALALLSSACDSDKPATTPASTSAPEPSPTTTSAHGTGTAPESTKHEKPEGIADACWGDLIDLSKIIPEQSCPATGEPRIAPEGAIEATLSVRNIYAKPGESTPMFLRLQNRSQDVVVFDIAPSCDPAFGFKGTLTHHEDKSVTPFALAPESRLEGWSGWCGKTSRCSYAPTRIALAPGKRAELPMVGVMKARAKDDDCKDTGGKPVAPGSYKVTVVAPLVGTPLEAVSAVKPKAP